jgi:hypothetical protein
MSNSAALSAGAETFDAALVPTADAAGGKFDGVTLAAGAGEVKFAGVALTVAVVFVADVFAGAAFVVGVLIAASVATGLPVVFDATAWLAGGGAAFRLTSTAGAAVVVEAKAVSASALGAGTKVVASSGEGCCAV